MSREVFLFFVLFFVLIASLGYLGSDFCQKREHFSCQTSCSIAFLNIVGIGSAFLLCFCKDTNCDEDYEDDDYEDDCDE